MRSAFVALAVVVSACAEASDPPAPGSDLEIEPGVSVDDPFVPMGEGSTDSQLALAWPPRATALRVRGPSDACLRIHDVRLGDGVSVPALADGADAFGCSGCSKPTVASREGLVLLFATPPSSLRVAEVDCATGLRRALPSAGRTLALSVASRPMGPLVLGVRLDLDDAWDTELVAGAWAVARERFADAGVRLRLVAVERTAGTRSVQVERDGRVAGRVLQAALPRAILASLVGCVESRRADGSFASVRGRASRAPLGASPQLGEAVFVARGPCDADGFTYTWNAMRLGQTIAHELGHALGGFHSDEPEGAADRDLEGPDLMAHDIGASDEPRRFSLQQRAVFSLHPFTHP